MPFGVTVKLLEAVFSAPPLGPVSVKLLAGAVVSKNRPETTAFVRLAVSVTRICTWPNSCISHAHEKGVLHRDVKPDNVYLVRQAGVRLHVRVLDFGIARMFHHDDSGGASLTRPGLVLGTPRYMAPEQLAGHILDARTDLYSAAVVLFEALTGQLPYVCGKRLRELCPSAQPELESLLEQC